MDLDSYRAEPEAATALPRSCTIDTDCATPDAGEATEQVCSRKQQVCTRLLTPECAISAGPALDPRAVRLGSLLDAASGNHQQSVMLAIEELNAAGGVTLAGEDAARPLALIACDSGQLQPAAAHLIEALGVQAIVGPASSQNAMDLATSHSIRAGVLSISPTATAGSLGDLLDDDLSWTMLPTDAQRAPLLFSQIAALEGALRSARERDALKLGIVLRNDALGAGTRSALSDLRWNGLPLSAAANLGSRVSILEYAPAPSAPSATLDALQRFAPDVVLLIGGPETVTHILQPLEARLSGTPASARPHYVLTEAAKVPELLASAAGDAELAPRVRGIGVTPSDAAQPVLERFVRSYERRWGAAPQDAAGAGASYDATYAIGYALAAAAAPEVRGVQIARGLRRLSGGEVTLSTGSADAEHGLEALAHGQMLDVLGTVDRLAWNERGLRQGGKLEVWCVQASGGAPRFASSGASYDVASQRLIAPERGCEPGADSAGDRTQRPAAGSPAAASGGDAQPPAAAMSGTQPPKDSPAGAEDGGAQAAPQRPSAMEIGLVAQYGAINRDPHDNVISPGLRIENRSSAQPIALAGLELRYYFSNEHAELCPAACVIDGFYGGIQPTGERISVRRRYVPREAPDSPPAYLSLSFERTFAALEQGQHVELQQQFHTNPYTELDETNDYSFARTHTSYADWKRVTVHREGVLVWGEPPP